MAKQNTKKKPVRRNGREAGGRSLADLFTTFASEAAHLSGKPLTFIAAASVVVVWAACGPLFGFSDTWQLVINTSTTIITFLMVFLIQNTQNRDTLAFQIKLAELIIAVQGAKSSLATAEDLSDDELQHLHAQYQNMAATALGHLERRRGKDGEADR